MNYKEKALSILKKLHKNGYNAYFCGGCVRDYLLQRSPKDYDIVTNAIPEQIQTIFKRTIPVGAQFGVMKVVFDKDIFEVATFRKDGKYKDGRRPEAINFSDEKEDALRRDFTINGLFYDPIYDRIIDYVGGREDIKRKFIRTIGIPKERFSEDYLRLMRAIRFSCQLNFSIEQETWKSICSMPELVQNVSKERIRDELMKMLISEQPAKALRMLKKSSLLFYILPELTEINKITWENMLSMLEIDAPIKSPQVAFSVLMLARQESEKKTIQSRTIEEICLSFCFSKKFTNEVKEIVRNIEMFDKLQTFDIAKIKKFIRGPYFEGLMELYRLKCSALKQNLDTYSYCQEKIQSFTYDELHPKPLITGHDLIMLGFQPGSIFQDILEFIENKQLLNIIDTKAKAIDIIKKEYKEVKGEKFDK